MVFLQEGKQTGMKKHLAGKIIAGAAASAAAAALVRTVLTKRQTSDYEMPASEEERALRYAEKLSCMVKVNTVSRAGVNMPEGIPEFHALLQELFPLVHEKLERIEIDGNLLFHWQGKNSETAIVLMSHQDVVPAEGEWVHPPFSGDIADGKVWGRGTSDTKCSLMAFLQATEELLKEEYLPACDVWLLSSCTEEWGGEGCPALVEELKRRGVKPWLVCDEGGGIIQEPIAGISGKYAMLGVFEKGAANLYFKARSKGGHASAPPKNTPLARLAAFINEVETTPVFRTEISPEVSAMFERLSKYAPFGYRLLFGNLWLFRPLMKVVLPWVSAQAGAMLKTTIAFTVASGADACNVIPQEATVGANMRFIPHQGMEESLAIIRAIAEKHDIEMEVIRANDYTSPADIEGEQFKLVESTVKETFPGLAVCPYVVTAATDARFLQEICDTCVRFAPVVYGPEQMKGMHGLNENLEYNCLPGAVDFYKNLIRKQEERV